MELCPGGQNFPQFGKSASQEIGFAPIMTGKGMMPLDNPIHIIRYLGKEFCAITLLKVFKQRTNLVKRNALIFLFI